MLVVDKQERTGIASVTIYEVNKFENDGEQPFYLEHYYLIEFLLTGHSSPKHVVCYNFNGEPNMIEVTVKHKQNGIEIHFKEFSGTHFLTDFKSIQSFDPVYFSFEFGIQKHIGLQPSFEETKVPYAYLSVVGEDVRFISYLTPQFLQVSYEGAKNRELILV